MRASRLLSWSVSSSDPESPGCGVFGVFLLALAAGIVTTVLWAGTLRRVAAAPGWSTVDARVVAATAHSRGRGSMVYSVIADVEYTVAGTKYEQFALPLGWGLTRAEAFARKPRLGSTMKLWHDPDDPGVVTLTSTWESSHSVRLWIIIGAWGLAALTLPILSYRFYMATQGVLITDT
jgi:Protein of unknown function (DUF3592)